MGYLLFPVRLPLLVLWVLGGLFTVMLVFPFLPSSHRQWAIRQWSLGLMACCGVSIRCRGVPVGDGPVLFVANHVSWVDIFVMNSVRPVSFIAKSDIRKWPLLGWLVAGAGTLFLERGRRYAVRSVGHQMLARFQRGEAIGLFPEGTTSLGLDVAPFHSNLFDPALRVGVDVQPVALLFQHRGRRTTRFAFVGDQTLLHNLWHLLTTTGTMVEMIFCPVISVAESGQLGRAGVAARAHSLIAEHVRIPGEACQDAALIDVA